MRAMVSATMRFGTGLTLQRWPLIALACLLALIFCQFLLKMNHTEHGQRSAFLRWRAQLEELDAGVNVWEKYAYPNPPIMALILKPFHQLPPLLGASLWFVCKALLALAAIVGVLTLLDSPARPFPLWGKILAIGMSLRPIEGDLVHGNVNLFILFLVMAMLIAFSRRCDGWAGLFLSLSMACKVTPALFLFYFLWKRAWTTLFGAAAGLVLFVIVVPAIAFGWTENLDYLRSWHGQMIAPYAAGVVSSEHKNQSLPGLLHRLLTDEPSFSDYDGDRKIVVETHNVVSWSRDTVQSINVGCMVLFAFVAMRFCRASIERRPSLELLAECSVVVLGMLLFSERTWKHHCVTLLLPFAVLSYCVASPTFSRGVRWYSGITLGLAGLLMASTSTGVFDHYLDAADRFGKLAQVYGVYVAAFLLLLASMFVILVKCREVNADTPRPSA